MKTKNLKLRLTLDVTFNLNDEPLKNLIYRMKQIVEDASNNGTFTGDSEATVESYTYSVDLVPLRKGTSEKNIICDTLQYKGNNIYICHDPLLRIYAVVMDEDGNKLGSTPFFDDIKNVESAAKTIVDQKKD